jgi:flagellin
VTDLTAQYELGYNTVNDVNFSMETAHLAKNQILQQAATAMLAQANQGQQSLLQLIQR